MRARTEKRASQEPMYAREKAKLPHDDGSPSVGFAEQRYPAPEVVFATGKTGKVEHESEDVIGGANRDRVALVVGGVEVDHARGRVVDDEISGVQVAVRNPAIVK